MDQKGRPLKIEDKVNLTLLINKQKQHALQAYQFDNILWNLEQENVIRYGFLSFARKYKKQLLNTRLDSFKNVSKKWSIKQVKSQDKR